MALVIVDDLNDVEDVVELMNYLARALASGNTEHLTLTRGPEPTVAHLEDLVRLDLDDEECQVAWHREWCSCVADAAATDPRQGIVVDADRNEGPVRYVPCPGRGTHARLTECWMCWCDVHRGAIDATDALIDFGVSR